MPEDDSDVEASFSLKVPVSRFFNEVLVGLYIVLLGQQSPRKQREATEKNMEGTHRWRWGRYKRVHLEETQTPRGWHVRGGHVGEGAFYAYHRTTDDEF